MVMWLILQYPTGTSDASRSIEIQARDTCETSAIGIGGEPRQPGYGASKAGLIAFGQSLARALGPHGISVAAVAPGITETDMAADALAGEGGDVRRAESPLGRLVTKEEVAAAVLFLASPEAGSRVAPCST